MTTPIFQTSMFRSDDEVYAGMEQGRPREITIYTRYGNPTRRAVERKVAALEGAEDAVTFASGTAAITAVFLAFCEAGDHVVAGSELYGGTSSLLQGELSRLGISCTMVDANDLDAVAAAITERTRVLHVETITNPLLRVADLAALAGVAHAGGALLTVDNTFATPVNARPLEQGADVVMESATKYLNGHSDLVAGVAAGSRERMDRVWKVMCSMGGSMEAISAFLLERGLKTLALRVRAQNASAAEVAGWLVGQPMVEAVHYPGLPDHPQHALASQALDGFGGMVAFTVAGGDAAGMRFMRALELIKEATSLGGVESVVSMPFNTSHSATLGFDEARRRAVGILPGTVRLSVGIEDPADLLADLDHALGAV